MSESVEQGTTIRLRVEWITPLGLPAAVTGQTLAIVGADAQGDLPVDQGSVVDEHATSNGVRPVGTYFYDLATTVEDTLLGAYTVTWTATADGTVLQAVEDLTVLPPVTLGVDDTWCQLDDVLTCTGQSGATQAAVNQAEIEIETYTGLRPARDRAELLRDPVMQYDVQKLAYAVAWRAVYWQRKWKASGGPGGLGSGDLDYLRQQKLKQLSMPGMSITLDADDGRLDDQTMFFLSKLSKATVALREEVDLERADDRMLVTRDTLLHLNNGDALRMFTQPIG